MPNDIPFSAPLPVSATGASTTRKALAVTVSMLAVALCAAPVASSPAKIKPVPVLPISGAVPAGSVTVEVDKAYLVSVTEPAKTVFVANPDIADVQMNDRNRVAIFGRKPGSTTIFITSASGRVSAYTVEVRRASDPVNAAVAAQAPHSDLKVSGAPGGLTMSGVAASPREAEAAKSAAQQFLGDKETLNLNAGVVGDTQVNLQVRIVEVSRNVTRSFGFNWNALTNNGSFAFGLATGRQILSGGFASFTRDPSVTNPADSIGFGYKSPGGSANINAVIDALQAEGVISLLAQPNLTAASGETASFLAGGEFPVPVSQTLNQQITVEWKQFGVKLDFTPTVLDAGRMSLRVRPEVSELSDKGAVVYNNIKIPAITVRRADTTVELASGQSFAIAGLFQNNISSEVNQYPWLANVPVLGPLFRSSSFTHDQSELVIIVTPYIVRPAAKPSDLKTPADSLAFANELEQVLLGKVAGGVTPSQTHLSGPAGFMLENKP